MTVIAYSPPSIAVKLSATSVTVSTRNLSRRSQHFQSNEINFEDNEPIVEESIENETSENEIVEEEPVGDEIAKDNPAKEDPIVEEYDEEEETEEVSNAYVM